jgi:hypothetical protein
VDVPTLTIRVITVISPGGTSSGSISMPGAQSHRGSESESVLEFAQLSHEMLVTEYVIGFGRRWGKFFIETNSPVARK